MSMTFFLRRSLYGLIWCGLLGCSKLVMAQLPPGFIDHRISGPWQYAAGVTFADNGLGYIWDSDGIVYILDSDGQIAPTPLLDIREQVVRFLNQGMLGFVLDPDFLENGYCYALYSADPHHWQHFGTDEYDPAKSEPYRATIGRISRFTADPNTGFRQIIPGSQQILVGKTAADGFPLVFESHAIGSLVFGADGSLLASCGDGASSTSVDVGSNPQTYYRDGLEDGILRADENVGVFRSQMINSLAGKIIRIDPATGDGLPGNPYFEATQPRSAQSRVWALGLRNPFRMSYVPGTGGHSDTDPGWLLIGDVGEGSWEEINLLQQAGQNFGWPFYEGFEAHPDYSDLEIVHPEYEVDCTDTPSFQSVYTAGGVPECCPDCPVFYPSTPRLAYRNRWNEITVPELVMAQDASHNAPGVAPEETSYPFEGVRFQGDASIGGCFYTGTVYPEAYRGLYFQADYRDWIRAFRLDEAGNFVAVDDFYTGAQKVISLAMNPVDELLYYISWDDFSLHRLSYGGPPPAQARIQVDRRWGASPLTLSFDGGQSVGASNQLTYDWSFGEGHSSQLPDPVFTFVTDDERPEVISVRLIVTDSLHQSDTAHIQIVLNDSPPAVEILSPISDLQYPMDGTYPILAKAAVRDQHTAAELLDYDWTLLLQHEDHTHVAANSTAKYPQLLLSPAGCVEDDYSYALYLTVTDENGLSASDHTFLYPNCNAEEWITFDFIRLSPNGNLAPLLSWQTSYELEVATFVIEAGNEVQEFQEIMIVPAHNELSGGNYRVPLPEWAADFRLYRIRAISTTPAFRLSPMVIPETDEDTPFARLRQQPVEQEVILDIAHVVSSRLRLALFDPNGRQLAYHFQEALIGQPASFRMNIDELPAGLYFYQLMDGPRVQWGRVLRQ